MNSPRFFLVSVVLIFSLWITVGFPAPGLYSVMAGFASIVGLSLLFLVANDYRDRGRVLFRFFFIFMALLSASVLSVIGGAEGGDVFKGTLQLVNSLLVSFALYHQLLRCKSRHVYLLTSFLILAIIFLSLLELVSAAAREFLALITKAIYKSDFIYNASARDLAVYGAVRPLVLTREPSHLAFLWVLLLALYYSFGESAKKLMVSLALFVFGLLVFRSPVLLAALPILALLWVYGHDMGSKQVIFRSTLISVAFVGFLALSSVVFSERLNLILDGLDFSATTRVIAPPMIAMDVLVDYPLVGVGLTEADRMRDYVYEHIGELGLLWRLYDFDHEVVGKFITNYFWLHWIYFGFFGGCLVLGAIIYFFKSVPGQGFMPALMSFCMLGQTIGGYVNLRTWVGFTVLMICFNRVCSR